MFYNFNFQTQANLDDAYFSDFNAMKAQALPTTSHNSPTSFKSESPQGFNIQFSHDNSFEAAAQIDHAKSVWDASVNYLKYSLSCTVDEETGFNNDKLYNTMNLRSSNQNTQKTLPESILKNKLLKLKEKTKFAQEIQKQTQICSLLVQLMILFNENIFNEMVFLIQNIWQKRYMPYRQHKQNSNRLSSLIPQFKCFFGFQNQEALFNRDMQMNDVSQAKDVKKASQEDIEALAQQLFRSKKLKYLNFSEIRARKNDQSVLKREFVVFLKALSKSVFLSAQGIYEQDVDIPIFSEQDEEDLSDFTLQNNNRFVRTFSQIQQEDEQFVIQPKNSKKRKFQ